MNYNLPLNPISNQTSKTQNTSNHNLQLLYKRPITPNLSLILIPQFIMSTGLKIVSTSNYAVLVEVIVVVNVIVAVPEFVIVESDVPDVKVVVYVLDVVVMAKAVSVVASPDNEVEVLKVTVTKACVKVG